MAYNIAKCYQSRSAAYGAFPKLVSRSGSFHRCAAAVTCLLYTVESLLLLDLSSCPLIRKPLLKMCGCLYARRCKAA